MSRLLVLPVFVVLALAAGCDSDGSPPTATTGFGRAPSLDDYNADYYLYTQSRQNLAICFDTINEDESLAQTAKDFVEEAWPNLLQHPGWAENRVSYPNPQLDVGCPGTPLLPTRLFNSIFSASELSPYFLHVYIVDGSVFDPQSQSARRGIWIGAEEDFCYGDSCSEVTRGLYVTAEVFHDTELMLACLKHGLYLERGPVEVPDNP